LTLGRLRETAEIQCRIDLTLGRLRETLLVLDYVKYFLFKF
jgi:hypothetical protein